MSSAMDIRYRRNTSSFLSTNFLSFTGSSADVQLPSTIVELLHARDATSKFTAGVLYFLATRFGDDFNVSRSRFSFIMKFDGGLPIEFDFFFKEILHLHPTYRKALACFEYAAERNHPGAVLRLAMMRGGGKGCKKDMEAYTAGLKKAAELKNPGAICKWTQYLLERGEISTEDANTQIRSAAESNDPRAVYQNAMASKEGESWLQDMLSCGKLHYEPAIERLWAYFENKGDMRSALIWAEHGAELQNGKSAYKASELYDKGKGTPDGLPNPARAKEYLEVSISEKSSPLALQKIARLRYVEAHHEWLDKTLLLLPDGDGVSSRKLVEAYGFFSYLYHEWNDIDAGAQMARMDINGIGLRSIPQGYDTLFKVFEAGSAKAGLYLGDEYGAHGDLEKAAQYYFDALDRGIRSARAEHKGEGSSKSVSKGSARQVLRRELFWKLAWISQAGFHPKHDCLWFSIKDITKSTRPWLEDIPRTKIQCRRCRETLRMNGGSRRGTVATARMLFDKSPKFKEEARRKGVWYDYLRKGCPKCGFNDHKFRKLNRAVIYRAYVRRGRDLLAMDSGGTSDPYIRGKFSTQPWKKSKVAKKTLNPKWRNFQLSTLCPRRMKRIHLRVECFDSDLVGTDDSMGTIEIALPLTKGKKDIRRDQFELYESKTKFSPEETVIFSRWVPLCPVQPDDEVSGDLYVTITAQILPNSHEDVVRSIRAEAVTRLCSGTNRIFNGSGNGTRRFQVLPTWDHAPSSHQYQLCHQYLGHPLSLSAGDVVMCLYDDTRDWGQFRINDVKQCFYDVICKGKRGAIPMNHDGVHPTPIHLKPYTMPRATKSNVLPRTCPYYDR